MIMKKLVLVLAMMISVSLLAQNTQQNTQNVGQFFCKSLDITGKVINENMSFFIEGNCGPDVKDKNEFCGLYSIVGRDVVVSKDRKSTRLNSSH